MKAQTTAIPKSLDWAHPVVREWFVERFGTPTEPQEMGWPQIVANKSVLITAPTGSGKTLAAFLACIDRLVRKSLDGKLEARTEVVYVSPFKALSNDVQKNLEGPLAEILAVAARQGLDMKEIRTAVRTGDTPTAERQSMLRKPPHILVTTPESLYILLTAEKPREMLRGVTTVIVDEIHAVADDKRGAHLALSLERLEALTDKPPVRIGLSATVKPIEEIAQFLAGSKRKTPTIIDVGQRRNFDIAVEVPNIPLAAVATHEMWDEIYNRIAGFTNDHRSTLVFVNTRKMAERLAYQLAERLGDSVVGTHHGSLSRKIRLDAEQKLKAGKLKVLVATASLKLGIDIGSVDLVCQIGSPRSIGVALQRIGRAGHWRGAIPKGRIFATTRDELIECAALIEAVKEGDLDRIQVPEKPMDVLTQQIVATCATGEWEEKELFNLMRKAYPYRDLKSKEFDEIIEMLSEGVAGRKVKYGKYLHRDGINHTVKGRRGARLIAITNGGAIPDNNNFTVLAEPDDTVVGTLDEDFAVESNRGDIILLGNTSWRIKRVEGVAARVRVEDAHGAAPTVPFWLGEAPARTIELSQHVARLRQKLSDLMPENGNLYEANPHPQAVEYLKENCGLQQHAAEQAVEYIDHGRRVLGAVPTQDTIIAERFFDEGGGMQLVLHAPFGGRINKAWGLALRKRFCRSFNLELQAAATDDGINISLTEQHSFPLADVFHYLHPASLEHVMEQTALQSPFFTVRWRWDATRSLALQRFNNGKKVPPHLQRMRSEDLLAAVFPEAAACQDNIEGEIEPPDHPLINEVMKDVLTEAMDLDGLMAVIQDVIGGKIKCIAIDTTAPSEFSHEILNANPYAFLDDAPLEERRARAVEMRRSLPDNVVEEIGRLDPDAIEQVRRDAMPDIRDADELHDLMMTLIALPVEALWPPGDVAVPAQSSQQMWGEHFDTLIAKGRAFQSERGGRHFWVAKERETAFEKLFAADCDGLANGADSAADGTHNADSCGAKSGDRLATREGVVDQMVAGFLMHSGPITSGMLARSMTLSEEDIDRALLRIESTGSVLRGNFTGTTEQTEWCERGLLARIHRLTVSTLRKQIEPVSAAQFLDWLFSWQHIAPGNQLVGEHGTLEIIKQLQGLEIPANAWESKILRNRVRNYKSDFLDKLCMTGVVGWARFSPHPAILGDAADGELTPGGAGRDIVGKANETGKSNGTANRGGASNGKTSGKSNGKLNGKSNGNGKSVATSGENANADEDYDAEDDARSGIRRVIPTSVSPIAFYSREDMDWVIVRHDNYDLSVLSTPARLVLESLKARGASFFLDLVRTTALLKSEVEMALWELVTAGLVTADGFDNLRALIDQKRRAGQGAYKRAARPRHSLGRWSVLDVSGGTEGDTAIEAACWMLLKRYGVVFRELLTRETNLPRWRELLLKFRRLEAQGKIRGGRFVTGFVGEQFALSSAVDSLRASKNRPKQEGEERIVIVSAADPLNLSGILVPGPRVASNSNREVVFGNGIFKDVVEPVLR